MTSASKIAANRRNASASTGPKTTQGRRRSARNALRHSLSLPIHSEPALSDEVEALTREIAGPGAKAEVQQLARRVAEAQLDLCRVRYTRHRWLTHALSDQPAAPSKFLSSTSETCDELARVLVKSAELLSAMDRYERRARSRRKFAIRALDEARLHLRQLHFRVESGESFGRTKPKRSIISNHKGNPCWPRANSTAADHPPRAMPPANGTGEQGRDGGIGSHRTFTASSLWEDAACTSQQSAWPVTIRSKTASAASDRCSSPRRQSHGFGCSVSDRDGRRQAADGADARIAPLSKRLDIAVAPLLDPSWGVFHVLRPIYSISSSPGSYYHGGIEQALTPTQARLVVNRSMRTPDDVNR
jgi:hypothetical protein